MNYEIIAPDGYFETVDEEQYKKLEEILEFLKKHAGVKVKIEETDEDFED